MKWYWTIFLIFPVLNSNAFGQTREIAFKSHSGNITYINHATPGNFGIVEPITTLDSIVKIDDSTVVFFYNNERNSVYYDTLVNDNNWLKPNLNLDSIRQRSNYGVPLIGFEPTKKDKSTSLKQKNKNKKKNSLPVIVPSNLPHTPQLILIVGLIIFCCVFSVLLYSKQTAQTI